jgi:hypothetical protein
MHVAAYRLDLAFTVVCSKRPYRKGDTKFLYVECISFYIHTIVVRLYHIHGSYVLFRYRSDRYLHYMYAIPECALRA